MTLYSKNGGEPVELPFADQDANGDTWTSLADNSEGRLACAWTGAPEAPTFDPAIEVLAWTDGAWTVTPKPADILAAELSAARAERLADLAAIRWQRQQTFLFAGQQAPADNDTITQISAKLQMAQIRGATPTTQIARMKFAPGPLTPVTYADLIAYGSAMDDHIQACFDHEAELAVAVLAASSLAALTAIGFDTGWPS